MKLVVVGMGYVGTNLAIAASKSGIEVVGIDSSEIRVKATTNEFNFKVSTNYSSVGNPDVVVIAVPTPINEDQKPDLQFLKSACESLHGVLQEKTLIINESTSYPGTLRNFIGPIFGGKHLLASAPERIDPGNQIWNIHNTARIVSGITDEATERAKSFYEMFCSDVVTVTTPEVAEAAKLFENTFRQVNIALVNQLSQIAKAIGISTFEILDSAATKPFGFLKFTPSLGVGGHCTPIDPMYLSYIADEFGVEASLVKVANDVNAGMPKFIANQIVSILGGSLKDKRIQIAGIAYKADVADVRESPAIVLMKLLREIGARVTWHDSLVYEWNGELSESLTDVDLGIIAVSHKGIDYRPWQNNKTIVIDVSTSRGHGWPKLL